MNGRTLAIICCCGLVVAEGLRPCTWRCWMMEVTTTRPTRTTKGRATSRLPDPTSVHALCDRSIPNETISLVPRRATASGVSSPSRYFGLNIDVGSPGSRRRVNPMSTW